MLGRAETPIGAELGATVGRLDEGIAEGEDDIMLVGILDKTVGVTDGFNVGIGL